MGVLGVGDGAPKFFSGGCILLLTGYTGVLVLIYRRRESAPLQRTGDDMAKKTTTTPKLLDRGYPPALRKESGNKVGWRFYSTLAEAKKAARVAEREAVRLEALGYDWGYQLPGRIEKSGNEFKVTVP